MDKDNALICKSTSKCMWVYVSITHHREYFLIMHACICDDDELFISFDIIIIWLAHK